MKLLFCFNKLVDTSEKCNGSNSIRGKIHAEQGFIQDFQFGGGGGGET